MDRCERTTWGETDTLTPHYDHSSELCCHRHPEAQGRLLDEGYMMASQPSLGMEGPVLGCGSQPSFLIVLP